MLSLLNREYRETLPSVKNHGNFLLILDCNVYYSSIEPPSLSFVKNVLKKVGEKFEEFFSAQMTDNCPFPLAPAFCTF